MTSKTLSLTRDPLAFVPGQLLVTAGRMTADGSAELERPRIFSRLLASVGRVCALPPGCDVMMFPWI